MDNIAGLNLEGARDLLDMLDRQMLDLLRMRGRLVQRARSLRLAAGGPGRDYQREEALVARLLLDWEDSAEDGGAYDSGVILRLWNILFEVSDEPGL